MSDEFDFIPNLQTFMWNRYIFYKAGSDGICVYFPTKSALILCINIINTAETAFLYTAFYLHF